MYVQSTIHWEDRQRRMKFIQEKIGFGVEVRTFEWDKGHPNGPELHTLTSNGIIIIRNKRTKKLVTALIARPNQIERYYVHNNEIPPIDLLNVAREHQMCGYNYK